MRAFAKTCFMYGCGRIDFLMRCLVIPGFSMGWKMSGSDGWIVLDCKYEWYSSIEIKPIYFRYEFLSLQAGVDDMDEFFSLRWGPRRVKLIWWMLCMPSRFFNSHSMRAGSNKKLWARQERHPDVKETSNHSITAKGIGHDENQAKWRESTALTKAI
jgi:hypothetical protein